MEIGILCPLAKNVFTYSYFLNSYKQKSNMEDNTIGLPPVDEELYALMLYNIRDYAVILLDPNGKIISWNKGAEIIKGYKKEEVIHRHFSIFYRSDDIDANVPDKNLAVAVTNGSFEEEGIRVRKNGSEFIAVVSITALINSEGNLRGFTKIVKDVTKTRETEKTFALERMESSLREKEVLLKEIHHRVKNNLQIISSLLNLQSSYLKDKNSVEIFKECQNRVRSMAIIHEKLYQSRDMSKINLSDYIKELVDNLFNSYSMDEDLITMHLDISDVMLEIDLAINLGLIINELVSNVFKHALPEGMKGNLYITLKNKNNKYSLIVEDDGKGFPPNIDIRKTESLGIQLIITLVDQIGGTVSLLRGKGSKLLIKFRN
jgi:PAS domain S-box-containing protein